VSTPAKSGPPNDPPKPPPIRGIAGIGSSRAKVYDEERPKTRSADVAGYEGAKRDIAEVVGFLHPSQAHGF